MLYHRQVDSQLCDSHNTHSKPFSKGNQSSVKVPFNHLTQVGPQNLGNDLFTQHVILNLFLFSSPRLRVLPVILSFLLTKTNNNLIRFAQSEIRRSKIIVKQSLQFLVFLGEPNTASIRFNLCLFEQHCIQYLLPAFELTISSHHEHECQHLATRPWLSVMVNGKRDQIW